MIVTFFCVSWFLWFVVCVISMCFVPDRPFALPLLLQAFPKNMATAWTFKVPSKGALI